MAIQEELEVLIHSDELNEERKHQDSTLDNEFTTITPDNRPKSLSAIATFARSLFSPPQSSTRISRHGPVVDTLITIWHLLRACVASLCAFILTLRPRYMRKGGLTPTKKMHVTSYLDALRGWAACIVVIHHFNPYKRLPLFSLPVINILDQGPAMVDIFFVISGYVLSYRMVKMIRTKQAVPLLDTAASSFFRRYIRLYGSAGAASFISMLAVQFNLAAPSLKQKNLIAQIWDWGKEFVHFSNIFAPMEGYYHSNMFNNKYLTVLWTIPVEFRGSMVVFAFCVGACKLSNRNRMALCLFLIAVSFYWTVVYVAMFMGGLFLAELSFTRHPERLGPLPSAPAGLLGVQEPKQLPKSQSLYEKIFFSCVLACAIFLLTQPVSAAMDLTLEHWPWPLFDQLIPSQYVLQGPRLKLHWWLSIGSLLLVWALDSYPALQTPLNWRFSQYLGHLSFGIYVMHWPVLLTLTHHVINPARARWLGNGMWTYAPAQFLTYAAILWAADLFIRVDERVVALGKWSQEKFFEW